jgi:hypothetical protein
MEGLPSSGTGGVEMSKFKAILAAKGRSDPKPEPEQHSEESLTMQIETVTPPPPTVTQESKKGRSRGKRSDPNYEQVSAYIKRETYRQVKIALLQKNNGQEFSDLVEELLSEWLSQ